MTRSFSKCLSLAAVVAMWFVVEAPVQALTLLSPTPDQIVRENVKITIPASALPDGFFDAGLGARPFVAVSVGQPGAEQFVQAVSAAAMVKSGNDVVFYWNSKSPYREPSDLRTDKFFKDGSYSLKVEIFEQNSKTSKVRESGSVRIVLKNKVDRPNPAPGVLLVNSLPFGQTNEYRIQTGLQLFDTLDMPILGAIGLTGDFKVIQTVEDVRPDGQIMLRYRLDEFASHGLFGQRNLPYLGQPLLPQLYRLVNKYGMVSVRNMFKKQEQYTITDVLPVLSPATVKEGDSWQDSMNLKVEGLTNTLNFSGVCRLDSFEWHSGRECAKLISQMTANGQIAFNGNKIRSSGRINAKVTTYFAYKTGKAITRVVELDFPVVLEQGAGEPAGDAATAVAAAPTAPTGPVAYGEDEDPVYGAYVPGGGQVRGTNPVQTAPAVPTQRGKGLLTVTIQLEK